MSLYLPEQKVGSHSNEGGSSNKFILKGRQTGAMHRGHTWVFRAESHDTMMAWYEDIKVLTEKTPEERNQFVRHHSRSLSQSSRRSASSDGGLVDEDDDEPFSADSQINVNPGPKFDTASRRSQPGGRFPSDIQVNAQRGLQATRSPSSVSSGGQEHQTTDFQIMAGAGALPGSGFPAEQYGHEQSRHGGYGDLEQSPINVPAAATIADQEAQHDGVNPYTSEPMGQAQQPTYQSERTYITPIVVPQGSQPQSQYNSANVGEEVHEDNYLGGYPAHGGISDATRTQQTNSNVVGGGTGYQPVEDARVQPTTSSGVYFAPTGQPVNAVGGEAPRRPTGNTTRNDSVNTISNLHVPGGYPRNSLA